MTDIRRHAITKLLFWMFVGIAERKLYCRTPETNGMSFAVHVDWHEDLTIQVDMILLDGAILW